MLIHKDIERNRLRRAFLAFVFPRHGKLVPNALVLYFVDHFAIIASLCNVPHPGQWNDLFHNLDLVTIDLERRMRV